QIEESIDDTECQTEETDPVIRPLVTQKNTANVGLLCDAARRVPNRAGLRPDGLRRASAACLRRDWRHGRSPLSKAAPTPALTAHPTGRRRRPDDRSPARPCAQAARRAESISRRESARAVRRIPLARARRRSGSKPRFPRALAA